MFGTGCALTEQCGKGETFAGGDLEGGFGAALGRVRAFAHHAALFDDVKVLDRAIGGLDNAVTRAVEAQLALLHQVGQVCVFHLIERREPLQELQGALDVLQHRRLPGFSEGVRFIHNHDGRLFRFVVVGVSAMVGPRAPSAHWT
ncbi:hypothetical protein D3C85_811160 [compost metagenome]